MVSGAPETFSITGTDSRFHHASSRLLNCTIPRSLMRAIVALLTILSRECRRGLSTTPTMHVALAVQRWKRHDSKCKSTKVESISVLHLYEVVSLLYLFLSSSLPPSLSLPDAQFDRVRPLSMRNVAFDTCRWKVAYLRVDTGFHLNGKQKRRRACSRGTRWNADFHRS